MWVRMQRSKEYNTKASMTWGHCQNSGYLQKIRENALSLQEEEVPIELNKVKEYVEQSIILLGQATNSMT